jgi:hypothetical protein
MDFVRMPGSAFSGVFHRRRAPTRLPPRRATITPPGRYRTGVPVLDVMYLVATLALFAFVGLIANGVEKL